MIVAAVEAVADSSDNIAESEVFDAYRSLLKHSDMVPGPIMSKLLDSISSGLSAELEATLRDIDAGDQQTYMAHKQPFEMYAFLLHWFVIAVEKVKVSEDGDGQTPAPKARKGKGGKAANSKAAGRAGANKKADTTWTWREQIKPTLQLISKILNQLQTQRLWTTTAERNTFLKCVFSHLETLYPSYTPLSCITRPAYYVTESEQYMKSEEIKKLAFKVICLAVKHHGQAAAVQINVMQSLQFYEHLSEPMADCLISLTKEYDYPQLGDEILREIAGKTFGGQDQKGPRTFARFLTKYAEACPRSVMKQLSLLQDQLDSEVCVTP